MWFHTVAERPFLWLMCTANARYEGLQVSPRAWELFHKEVVTSVLLQKAALWMAYTENLKEDREVKTE